MVLTPSQELRVGRAPQALFEYVDHVHLPLAEGGGRRHGHMFVQEEPGSPPIGHPAWLCDSNRSMRSFSASISSIVSENRSA